MSTPKIRCLNIDWLEVYCLEPLDEPRTPQFFMSHGWQVEERPYGTRSYRQMFTLLDHEDQTPFIEVRRDPVGMFKNGEKSYGDINGCHIRLVNRWCYSDQAALFMQQFIEQAGLTFVRISKVDLALDFELFDFGDRPAAFLARYMAGRFSKLNQAAISAHGTDEWHARVWSSVSWGSKSSAVYTRFYCKSKELAEVADKPYIRQAWGLAHLVDDVVTMTKTDEDGQPYKPDIWRLEFSLTSKVKNWITINDQLSPFNNKRSFRNTLDVYTTREQICTLFASLANHYFHFRYYKEGVSKYKSQDKRLFDFSQSAFYKVERLATARPRSDIAERLLKLLRQFVVVHHDDNINKAANLLIEDIRRFQLERMAQHPWDDSEVRLLRRLIARRLENTDEQFAVSLEVARAMASIEQTLWDEQQEAKAIPAPTPIDVHLGAVQ